jgi:NADH-quinone oxidoreductase subunit J
MNLEQIFFLIFAVVAVVSALGVVTLKNPVHCVLSLITCLFQVACLFVLLRSPFLAVVQIFIYVGAVLVFFLFVALLLDVKKVGMEAFPLRKRGAALWVLVAVSVEVVVVLFMSGFERAALSAPGPMVNVEALGKELFTSYLFPFEVVSVLLLVAIVGAVIMMKERRG